MIRFKIHQIATIEQIKDCLNEEHFEAYETYIKNDIQKFINYSRDREIGFSINDINEDWCILCGIFKYNPSNSFKKYEKNSLLNLFTRTTIFVDENGSKYGITPIDELPESKNFRYKLYRREEHYRNKPCKKFPESNFILSKYKNIDNEEVCLIYYKLSKLDEEMLLDSDLLTNNIIEYNGNFFKAAGFVYQNKTINIYDESNIWQLNFKIQSSTLIELDLGYYEVRQINELCIRIRYNIALDSKITDEARTILSKDKLETIRKATQH